MDNISFRNKDRQTDRREGLIVIIRYKDILLYNTLILK